MLVRETNRYAEHAIALAADLAAIAAEDIFPPTTRNKYHISANSRLKAWKPTDAEEMKRFIGLLIVMGIVDKPTIHEYWTTDLLDSTPNFSQTMSRNRFQLLLHCFHCADNANFDNGDALYKVRPMLNAFHDTMTSIYYPGKRIALDESLMGFRGRTSHRQYIPDKTEKYGIKFFTLADSCNAMLYRIILYCGKKDQDVSGTGHAWKVVLALIADLLNNGHSLYMDNFYNTVQLALHLLDNKTYMTGTMRPSYLDCCPPVRGPKKNNKKETELIVYPRLRKGSVVRRVTMNGQIEVSKWIDKKPVLMISTEHPVTLLPPRNRYENDDVARPLCVQCYNDSMGGVDQTDQMMSYYSALRKNYSWAKKVTIHIIDMMLHNAYVMYKANVPRSPDKIRNLKNFRKYVARVYTHTPDMRKATPLPPRPVPNALVAAADIRGTPTRQAVVYMTNHTPTKIGRLSRRGKSTPLQRLCVYCRAQNAKSQKRTVYQCGKCPGAPALCRASCFAKYHYAKRLATPTQTEDEALSSVRFIDDSNQQFEQLDAEDGGGGDELSVGEAADDAGDEIHDEYSFVREADEQTRESTASRALPVLFVRKPSIVEPFVKVEPDDAYTYPS